VALGDPITKFLPDFPTQNHTVTVEHLLTHTSGIHSHEDVPEWLPLQRRDFGVQELIDSFKDQPMQCAPGTRWAENNMGYILLGAIIERVSGQSYERFIQERIFDSLGMRHSYYDSGRRIIPGRVSGYEKAPDGYTNAEYISLNEPHAAGALASTLDDLARWDAALHAGELVSTTTLQRAWTSYRLSDGTRTGYGYGWSVGTWRGRSTAEHQGIINGIRTYLLRMPEEDVFVAILSNCYGGMHPELAGLKVAALLVGQPYQEPVPARVSPEQLSACAGIYQFPIMGERVVVPEGDHLIYGPLEGWRLRLVPLSPTEFCFPNLPDSGMIFTMDKSGRCLGAELYRRQGDPQVATRRDIPG